MYTQFYLFISGNSLACEPKWKLDGKQIKNVNNFEILGMLFEATDNKHADKRAENCKRSFYNLRNIGMSYPGAGTDVKAYIWKSMCQPILLYGSDCMSLGKLGKQKLETSQANLLKQCLGLSKRCHSTDLLRALNVKRIADLSAQNSVNLLRRAFECTFPFTVSVYLFYILYD